MLQAVKIPTKYQLGFKRPQLLSRLKYKQIPPNDLILEHKIFCRMVCRLIYFAFVVF